MRRDDDDGEIDAVAAYCAELDRCHLVPAWELGEQRNVQLRPGPTADNQRRGVRWAARYEFGSVDWNEFTFMGP